jgi:hypothetical protein
MVAVLERLKGTVGLPQRIAVDHGPAFIAKTLEDPRRLSRPERGEVGVLTARKIHGQRLRRVVQRTLPSGVSESVLVRDMAEARAVIAAWRVADHTERLYRALGQRTPTVFLTGNHSRRQRTNPTGGPIGRQVRNCP